MTNLILDEVGNKYIETLIKDYHKIPSDFSVTIYTSDVVKIKSNIKNVQMFLNILQKVLSISISLNLQ